MDIQINGTTLSLLPRVAAMLELLYLHQRDIERHEFGKVTFDFNTSRVQVVLPSDRDVTKPTSSPEEIRALMRRLAKT